MMMNTVKVSVLGHKEDGHWVAHALEMDIIGVGDSWQGALAELNGNIRAQVSFARSLGDDSLVFRAAPAHLFRKFNWRRLNSIWRSFRGWMRTMVSLSGMKCFDFALRGSRYRFKQFEVSFPASLAEDGLEGAHFVAGFEEAA